MKIEELKKLEKAATPGPWEVVGWCIEDGPGSIVVNDSEMDFDNAALIVAARNALPALLAVAEAAQRLRGVPDDSCSSDEEDAAIKALDAAIAALEATK